LALTIGAISCIAWFSTIGPTATISHYCQALAAHDFTKAATFIDSNEDFSAEDLRNLIKKAEKVAGAPLAYCRPASGQEIARESYPPDHGNAFGAKTTFLVEYGLYQVIASHIPPLGRGYSVGVGLKMIFQKPSTPATYLMPLCRLTPNNNHWVLEGECFDLYSGCSLDSPSDEIHWCESPVIGHMKRR
jgi:hypothetical protein